MLKSKRINHKKENIRVLTDSECCLIWSRILCSRFRIGIQTLITKLSLILYDLNLCPFKNINHINQHSFDFPVDQLTKLKFKENFKSIEKRHTKLRECSWLYSINTLLEVINFPWFQQHETKEYIPIT